MSGTHDHSVAFVRTEQVPQSAPPFTTSGPVKWAKDNLFSTPAYSLLTIAAAYVIYLILGSTVPWILNGVWSASSLTQCREILDGVSGGCFAVLTERWNQLLFGFKYPSELYWRPTLAFVFLIVAIAPVLFFKLPRQLLMLKVAGEALQDAGLSQEELLFTGVFIGTGLDLNATSFSFRWGIQKWARKWAQQLGRDLSDSELAAWITALRESTGPALNANRVMGALGSIVASRIAKEFRVGGPSFTLSSEDNSGLRALEVGVRALQEGSINRAIVGAADMAGDLRSVLGRHASQPFSKNGIARPFDKDADGTVIGEGAAAVILKRLDDARQDGDRIYAIIKGIGTATGGQIESSLPDESAYTLSVERTVAEAGAPAESVSYLETNGSGLAAEDKLEADVLGSIFGASQTQNPCYIGSAKADVGHAGAAAGLASLIKATLCLEQQILPPLRNLQSLRYDWVRGKRNFVAADAAQFWLRNRTEGVRRALVSGLGNDGTCSHVLLEGAEDKTGRPNTTAAERPLGPLDEGQDFAPVLDPAVVPLVPLLVLSSCPTAVLWRVPLVVVETVY